MGGHVKAGSKRVGAEIGAYAEQYTVKLDDGKFSTGSTIQAGVGVHVPSVIEISAEYKAYNTFKGSRYTNPLRAIGEDPNSEISKGMQAKVFDLDFLSVSPDDIKIGFDVAFAMGVEGRIDFQFNLTEVGIRLFTEWWGGVVWRKTLNKLYH